MMDLAGRLSKKLRRKPVFGRGGRRKRRLERDVPPRGAGPFWPAPWKSVRERDMTRRFLLHFGLLALGGIALYALGARA